MPGREVDATELRVLRLRKLLKAFPVQILEARHDAKRRIDAAREPLAALDDPLQHAHVLAESRPDELSLSIASEPVHAEDARRLLYGAAHPQPMVEVVAHVVAAEGKHGHRIAPPHPPFAGDRGRGLL